MQKLIAENEDKKAHCYANNYSAGRQELYRLLDEGMEDVKNGNVLPFREAMREIRKKIAE